VVAYRVLRPAYGDGKRGTPYATREPQDARGTRAGVRLKFRSRLFRLPGTSVLIFEKKLLNIDIPVGILTITLTTTGQASAGDRSLESEWIGGRLYPQPEKEGVYAAFVPFLAIWKRLGVHGSRSYRSKPVLDVRGVGSGSLMSEVSHLVEEPTRDRGVSKVRVAQERVPTHDFLGAPLTKAGEEKFLAESASPVPTGDGRLCTRP